jgi:hypothetical protein
MDMYEYNRLSLGEKTRFLWQDATFIERHEDSHYTRSLYHACDFYIEATVSHKENRIVEITTFRSVERLDKYLEKVNLAALILG